MESSILLCPVGPCKRCARKNRRRRGPLSSARVALTPAGDRLYSQQTGISGRSPGFTHLAPRLMRIRGASRTTTGGRASGPTPDFEREALACLDSLYRTALRLSRDRADAEDLVQDTYLKAFRAADRFEPGTNLRAWLFTILHNTARNRFRDRSRDAVTVDSEVVDRAADAPPNVAAAGVSETPETLLLRNALPPDLQAAIDGMPAAFREAVWLRDVEEFTYAEIAAMLGVPPGTVMSRISRGRR